MNGLVETFMDFRSILLSGTIETLYMVFISVILAYAIGIPVGTLLVVSDDDGLSPNKVVSRVLGGVVNAIRSIPFVLTIVILIPFTRWIVGTALGSPAAIVPLVIGSFPFISRMVEASLREIDTGVIDAARSMGANNFQIITKVLIPECIPSLVRGFSITTILLISFSAMAGAVGAGGLGRIAIRYGYQRFQNDVMFLTLAIIVVIVAIIQFAFNTIAAKLDKTLL